MSSQTINDNLRLSCVTAGRSFVACGPFAANPFCDRHWSWKSRWLSSPTSVPGTCAYWWPTRALTFWSTPAFAGGSTSFWRRLRVFPPPSPLVPVSTNSGFSNHFSSNSRCLISIMFHMFNIIKFIDPFFILINLTFTFIMQFKLYSFILFQTATALVTIWFASSELNLSILIQQLNFAELVFYQLVQIEPAFCGFDYSFSGLGWLVEIEFVHFLKHASNHLDRVHLLLFINLSVHQSLLNLFIVKLNAHVFFECVYLFICSMKFAYHVKIYSFMHCGRINSMNWIYLSTNSMNCKTQRRFVR